MEKNEKLQTGKLGIAKDNQLKFKKHIENLYKKSSFKLHDLHRIRNLER